MNEQLAPRTADAGGGARLQNFRFQDITIPTVEVDGKRWLSATPLCRALALSVDRRHPAGRYIAAVSHAERDYRYMPTSSGLQRCAVLTLAGAVQLTELRKRPIDAEVRRSLMLSAAEQLDGRSHGD